MKTLAQYKKEEMAKDPEFAKEYQDGAAEFAATTLIVEARIKEGLTQKDLAERSGIKASSLNRFENGRNSPTLDMLNKLAKGLGKTLKIEFV